MATGVIHFGVDDCSRVLVLQNAGYRVNHCCFIPELKAALHAPLRPSVTLFSESGGETRSEAASLIRSCTIHTPIIFFSNAYEPCDEESRPDLIVPPFTTPERWLRWIASVIEQSRALQAASASLREKSASLRQNASAVGERSVLERMRAQQTRVDMEDFMRCVTPVLGRSGLPN